MICDPTELNVQSFWHFLFKLLNRGTSLAIQWLRLHASTPRGAGSIPGWGTKIPHASGLKKRNKIWVLFLKPACPWGVSFLALWASVSWFVKWSVQMRRGFMKLLRNPDFCYFHPVQLHPEHSLWVLQQWFADCGAQLLVECKMSCIGLWSFKFKKRNN